MRADHPRSTTAILSARVLSLIAMLVMAMGISRVLVLCDGAHCEARIEFAHAARHCCERVVHEQASHEHGEVCEHADPDGDSACEGHGDCSDVALGASWTPAPPPSEKAIDHGDAACIGCVAAPPPPQHASEGSVPLPPSTGPPRPDPGTELLASTHLLL